MTGAHAHRELGILSVALITYFNVSGGPWGSEPIIASCGPLIGIIAVIVFPWIWCLPVSLTFAELFTAFPTDGSFCKWVGVAFGKSMGFQVGYWSWISGVIDNAIYPCLIVDTLKILFNHGTNEAMVDGNFDSYFDWNRFLARTAIASLFMLPTHSNIKIVGNTLLLMCILVFLPFSALVAVSLPQIRIRNWFVVSENRDWGRLLSSLYWNYSGFDAAGAYAGEIRSPRTTYPRAMMLTVFMIAVTYVVPFLAISGVDKPHYTQWKDGSYTVIAQAIGGTWLCVWVLTSSLFGNLGLYVAEMTKDGFQLAGMADSGLAPPFFAQRDHKSGAPRRAILLSFCMIIGMGIFDFDAIQGIDNFYSALASLVEMCAAVRMRFSHPKLERPYRINLSNNALLMAMTLPFSVGVFILLNELFKSWTSFWINSLVLLVGVIMYLLQSKYPYHQYVAITTQSFELEDETRECRE
uniref:Amino AcidPolyamineOrganocation (APC) Family putati n=1 Tax=Albugo laibachii Nc14 TaxID=890382 RepID=F0WWZ8_9STRA|nr:Amino AcidPolyamineOrganocation (APC) Family putati [Albugo laibachii Nc14]|eukprot:CCA25984.1 Amino AcidPolyamineOrganocation (APC) Family putati [Albugo laibachii Nc14]